jgi:hypothetical protein
MKDMFEEALKAEGITGQLADVARSIYMQESSGGKNTETSNKGAPASKRAHGGMQILPGTFKDMADKGWDINDPMHNARAGVRYLKHLDKLSGGDPTLTAVGYYSGPGGMAKAKQGIARYDKRNPGAPNSLEYGRQVVARLPGNTQHKQLTNALTVPSTMLPGRRDGASILSAPDSEVAPYYGAEYTPPEEFMNINNPKMAQAPDSGLMRDKVQFEKMAPAEIAQLAQEAPMDNSAPDPKYALAPYAEEKARAILGQPADPWKEFDNMFAYKQEVTPQALDFGKQTVMAPEQVQPNFKKFGAWGDLA